MTVPQIHEVLLGHSVAIRKVRALIERVAPTELPVLISAHWLRKGARGERDTRCEPQKWHTRLVQRVRDRGHNV